MDINIKDGFYQYILSKPPIGNSLFLANFYMKEYRKEQQRKLRENKIKRILGE
jgi:hypothetical protein